ncbi:hypothetical protein GIB67_008725 [Kingdonia uniflora]|uniref:Uncharacterized protein n=1 Tax=Kingdonia uniflora TaxID=39325 RepID=A0A7J7NGL1_9MAGN|nr:hypothetical protein GIB67_008725 [Kingdonia uniflora]
MRDVQVVEMKEAKHASLKDSKRLVKEIVENQELKKKFSTMIVDDYFCEASRASKEV